MVSYIFENYDVLARRLGSERSLLHDECQPVHGILFGLSLIEKKDARWHEAGDSYC